MSMENLQLVFLEVSALSFPSKEYDVLEGAVVQGTLRQLARREKLFEWHGTNPEARLRRQIAIKPTKSTKLTDRG